MREGRPPAPADSTLAQFAHMLSDGSLKTEFVEFPEPA
jgi:hypothetical protein